MKQTYKLTLMAMLVAIGTFGSSMLWIPAGIAKAYPVQHAINVLAAVLLGPIPAVAIAFVIGLLRNLLGVGTLLAFPGGMIGALLAGYLFQKLKRPWGASVGEVVGTGLIAPLVCVPFAQLFMGKDIAALALMPSFLVSTSVGALIGLFLVSRLRKTNAFSPGTMESLKN